MAPPLDALLALASGLTLGALAALLAPSVRRDRWRALLAAFVALWGLQVVAANAGRVLEDARVHAIAFPVSLALLPAATFFLAAFALRVAGIGHRAAYLAAAAVPATAAAVFILAPRAVVAGVRAPFVTELGWAAVPLVIAPFFAAFYLALAASYFAYRRDVGVGRLRARGFLAALALFVGYASVRQLLVYLSPPPGVPAVPPAGAFGLVALFAVGTLLFLALAGSLALRPAGRRDPLLLAAFAVPAAWAAAEWALAGPALDSVGLWRLAAVGVLVWHEHEAAVAARVAEVEQLNVALTRANADLESFSSAVSHDLRTPLRGIEALGSAVLEDESARLSGDGRENLARVVTTASEAGRRVEGLLRLSRATRQPLHVESVDLTALARAILDERRRRDPSRDVVAIVDEGVRAPGDPDLLRALLENLLDNAWKYTARVPQAAIEVRVTRTPTGRALVVRDNGPGFDMAKADRLFAAFTRLHGREYPGSGLGLATVARIAQRHGGRAWAEAAEGKGAAFFVELPGLSSAPAG